MAQTKLNNSQLPDIIQGKTIDTSNDIDTTTSKLTITGGSNGQVLSTDGSGNLSWTTAGALGAPTAVVTKTADESVTNSNTPQDDNELFYALTANKTYFIQMNWIFSRANTSNSNAPRVAVSGNSEGTHVQSNNVVLCDGSANFVIAPTGAPAASRVPSVSYISIRPSINTTLQVKWAQFLSSTNTVTVYAGTQMLIWEVA